MAEIGAAARPAGGEDFDFLHGAWHVRHRRLKTRLAGSADWAEFGGTMQADSILGGLGNFDWNVIDLPGEPYEACTLRLFDVASGCWSLHWIDGRHGKLDPPLTGRFANGIGQFFGDDVFEGRRIRVRFLWSQPSSGGPRWEQAFSADAGANWETNWIMEFTRA